MTRSAAAQTTSRCLSDAAAAAHRATRLCVDEERLVGRANKPAQHGLPLKLAAMPTVCGGTVQALCPHTPTPQTAASRARIA